MPTRMSARILVANAWISQRPAFLARLSTVLIDTASNSRYARAHPPCGEPGVPSRLCSLPTQSDVSWFDCFGS